MIFSGDQKRRIDYDDEQWVGVISWTVWELKTVVCGIFFVDCRLWWQHRADKDLQHHWDVLLAFQFHIWWDTFQLSAEFPYFAIIVLKLFYIAVKSFLCGLKMDIESLCRRNLTLSLSIKCKKSYNYIRDCNLLDSMLFLHLVTNCVYLVS